MGLHCLIVGVVKMLCYTIVAALCALGLLCLVLKHHSSHHHKYFGFVFHFLEARMKALLVPFKKQLFKDLDKVESNDPELKKKGLFRLLEIGIGEGANLEYYPKNGRLICLDPNENFYQHYEKQKAKYSDLVVEKFLKSGAEDMNDIPDGSVDVVVSTHVLCSVKDVDRVLREVKRVLCQDGQYLLFERIASPPNTGTYTFQSFLTPLWKFIFGGCNLSCKTDEQLKNAGFSKLEVETVTISGMPSIINRHILGKAFK